MQGEGDLVTRIYVDGITCEGGFAIAGLNHLRLDLSDVYGDEPDEVYHNVIVAASEDELRELRDAIDTYLEEANN